MTIKAVGRRGVRERLPVSDMWIDRKVAQGEFPPPFKLGKIDLWLESWIDDYLLEKSKCRKQPTSPERHARLSAAGKKGNAVRWGTAA